MNIWNTDDIATRLARGEMNQHQMTKYYIACFYLQVIWSVLPMYILGYSYSINLFTFASFVIAVVVFHLGALNVYRACAYYQKASVLDTLVVLSLPVCIKVQLGYWATYFAISTFTQTMENPMYVWVLYTFFTMPVIIWLQFFLIRRAVHRNYA